VVEDYSFESSWGDYIELAAYLVERNGQYKLGTLSYLTREVLNDSFDEPLAMCPGAILQGVILAYGCVPIPKELAGRLVPVRFTLVDTLGRESEGEIRLLYTPTKHSSELKISIDRTTTMQYAAAPRQCELRGREVFLEEG
jgi:hypothetical protein